MIGFVMMALGAYRFAVASGGYTSLKRKNDWRWASTEVVGAPPVLQYTGPGEENISIEGTIFPHFRGGLGQCEAMRAQAGFGTPLPLIDGSGRFWGLFVITSVEETRTVFMPDGAPRKIEFTIELKKYS